MTTLEIINNVCNKLGISKAALAKKIGMLPSSLYRKLDRDSMSLQELQKCLDLLNVSLSVNINYPDGTVQDPQVNYELLLEKYNVINKELTTVNMTTEFQRKSLKELRTELTNASAYLELSKKRTDDASLYLNKVRTSLNSMDVTIAYALGEEPSIKKQSNEPINLEVLKGKRILIVEDNELNRSVIKDILSDYDLTIEEVNSGKDAITQINQNVPGYYQCILMDIEMPEMDGFETTINIRNLNNRIRSNTPIIALTANATSTNKEKSVVVGMDGFLTKPIDTNQLLYSLEKVL